MDEKYIQQLYNDFASRYGANNILPYKDFQTRIASDKNFQQQTYNDLATHYGKENILSFNDFSGKIGYDSKEVQQPAAQVKSPESTAFENQLNANYKPSENNLGIDTGMMPNVPPVKLPQQQLSEFGQKMLAGHTTATDNAVSVQPQNTAKFIQATTNAEQQKQKRITDTPAAIDHTASLFFKDKTPSPEELQSKKTELAKGLEKGDYVLYYGTDGKPRVGDNVGGLKALWEGTKEGFKKEAEARQFVDMDKDKQIAHMNEKSKEDDQYLKPIYDYSVTGGLGNTIGQGAPMMGKAIVGATVGAGLTAAGAPEGLPGALAFLFSAPGAANTAYMEGLTKRFKEGKEQGLSDSEAYDKAHNQALVDESISLATTGFLSRIPVTKATGEGLQNSIKAFIKQGGKSSAEFGAVSAAGTAVGETAAKAQGFDKNTSYGDIVGESLQSGGEGALMGMALHVVSHPEILLSLPYHLQAQFKHYVAKAKPEEINTALDELKDKGQANADDVEKAKQDIASFKQASDRVPDNIPEDKQVAITTLIQDKLDLQEQHKNKLKNTDEAFHDDINKEFEPKITDINDKIIAVKNGDLEPKKVLENGKLNSDVTEGQDKGNDTGIPGSDEGSGGVSAAGEKNELPQKEKVEDVGEVIQPQQEGFSQRIDRQIEETKQARNNDTEAQRKADVLINGVKPELKEFTEKYNGWILGKNDKPEINTAEEGQVGKILRLTYSDLSDKEMQDQLKEFGKAYSFYGSSLPKAKEALPEQPKQTSNEGIVENGGKIKPAWESNIEALVHPETGLAAVTKKILNEQQPLKDKFLEKQGLTREDYRKLNDAEKEAIQKKWVKSDEFKQLENEPTQTEKPTELNQQKSDELHEAGKPVKEPVRQDRINDLIELTDRFNKLRSNAKDKASTLNTIRIKAKELGLNVNYGKGFARIENENGNRVFRRSTTNNKSETEFDVNSYADKTKETVNRLTEDPDLASGLAIVGEDGRHMSQKQKENALKDIKQGKNTKGAKAVYDALEEMVNDDMVHWRNSETGQKDGIKFDDYFAEPTKELTDEDIIRLNSELHEDAFEHAIDNIRYDEGETTGTPEMAEQPAAETANEGTQATGRSDTPTSKEEKVKIAQAEHDKAQKDLKSAEDRISKEQAKQNDMFAGGAQKGMFGMGRDEAKDILDPLRKKVKETKAELDKALKEKEVAEEKSGDMFEEEFPEDGETMFVENNKKSHKKDAAQEATKPLTEIGFYKKYRGVHIDLKGGESNSTEANKKSIQDQGFHEAFNVNALPLTEERNENTKKGQVLYLIPKEGLKDSANGYKIKTGWKPLDTEVVMIEYDGQSIYDAYVKQHERTNRKNGEEFPEDNGGDEFATGVFKEGTEQKSTKDKVSKAC
jgi:hypothetical protein